MEVGNREALREVVTRSGLFAATIFVSATLVFTCQPMMARMLVPLLGGAPAVWIVCSLFFQSVLLAGYAYVHVTGTRLRVPTQIKLQLVLVGAVFLVLPVAVSGSAAARLASGHPTLGLLLLLLQTIGLPFFVLSTTSPLLQRWFAEVGESDPYYLYAASNAGSMLTLLAYPFVVEPLLPVHTQARAMHFGFGLYAILIVVCAVTTSKNRGTLRIDATPAPPAIRTTSSVVPVARATTTAEKMRERIVWLALAFAPSSLLLGATEYVTTDLTSIPLLWVVPLALYLASFVVAFGKRQSIATTLYSRGLLILAVVVAIIMVFRIERPSWLVVAAHMALLFVGSVICHRALASRRPHVSRLTEFYLLLSVGGVLGGLFNGIVAPSLFSDLWEYPLAIGLVCAARGLVLVQPSRAEIARNAAFGFVLAGVVVGAMLHGGEMGTPLFSERSFFGVIKVMRSRDEKFQLFYSGHALQGKQATDEQERHVPLAYYHPTGPAGDVLDPADSRASRRVGVIGLGIGSLVAYADPGDEWTFFEVNPTAVKVARSYFTYLSDAEKGAKVDIEVGDARLRLDEGPKERFDILVLDALSSDAIPIHLVTRDAVAVYRRVLRPDGIVLAHLTNDHLELQPVFAALARETGLSALEKRDASSAEGRHPSEWVVLGGSEMEQARLRALGWRKLEARVVPAWSDDFANVLGAVRF